MEDSDKYHPIYRMRDKEGNDFSNLLELHIIELRKKLAGDEKLDDWIRLFNATSKEDLNMIKTQNAGILEAIEEVKRMGLSKKLRYLHEERMKIKRDQIARENYVLELGEEKGRIKGRIEGKIDAVDSLMAKQHLSLQEACSILDISVEEYRH